MFVVLTVIAIVYAGFQYHQANPDYAINGLLINTFWGLYNIFALSGLIMAAFWKPGEEK